MYFLSLSLNITSISYEVSNDSLSHMLGVMGDSDIVISSYIDGTVIIKHDRNMKCTFCKTSDRCTSWLNGQLMTVSIHSLKEEDNHKCDKESEEVQVVVQQGQWFSSLISSLLKHMSKNTIRSARRGLIVNELMTLCFDS